MEPLHIKLNYCEHRLLNDWLSAWLLVSHTNLIHSFLEPSRINLNYLERGILLDCLSGLLALKICELMSVADISTSIHLKWSHLPKSRWNLLRGKKNLCSSLPSCSKPLSSIVNEIVKFLWKTCQNLPVFFKFSDMGLILSKLVETCPNLC